MKLAIDKEKRTAGLKKRFMWFFLGFLSCLSVASAYSFWDASLILYGTLDATTKDGQPVFVTYTEGGDRGFSLMGELITPYLRYKMDCDQKIVVNPKEINKEELLKFRKEHCKTPWIPSISLARRNWEADAGRIQVLPLFVDPEEEIRSKLDENLTVPPVTRQISF
jgi:hypothetical protein